MGSWCHRLWSELLQSNQKHVAFPINSILSSIIPNLFLLYTNPPTKSQTTAVTLRDFQNGLEEQAVEHKE